MSFFNVSALAGNPFSTPIGQKIEQATDGGLASENWALNMEICDLVNANSEGPKDAIKAIRKRLQQSAGKNYTTVMYTLTVLETCVKNCGKSFHILVANKEFIQDLVKLIGPKNDPPTAVQEKVLSLIQCWADAFQHQSDLSGVVTVYQELRSKGVEFPMTDLDTMAPIYTPQRYPVSRDCNLLETDPVFQLEWIQHLQSLAIAQEYHNMPAVIKALEAIKNNVLNSYDSVPEDIVDGVSGGEPLSISPVHLGSASPHEGTNPTSNMVPLSSEQITKLHSDLAIVQGNMVVMGDMLSEMTESRSHHPSDIELLTELHSTLQAMQSRLVELIGKLSDDVLTGEMLRVNDDLNGVMLRYQRFTKNIKASTPSAALAAAMGQPPTQGSTPAPAKPSEPSLIDLGEDTPNLAALSLNEKKPNAEKDEFDMFAQSRNLTYDSSKNGSSSYADNLDPGHANVGLAALTQSRPTTGQPQTLQNERDFDEIEAWLRADESSGQTSEPKESVTSSDFDKFLAERAAAIDHPPPTHSTNQQQPKKKDDDGMFAL